ncbi:MAG TPA: EipA family protein, partial [Beijerinckiaceae bacterium]|nr:EipA family protein [Beijerinckiaceae bacterium]
GGVDGSAYLVGGFGLTALRADDVVIVPIRTGIGARLGLNLGYIKFTPESTWNPF